LKPRPLSFVTAQCRMSTNDRSTQAAFCFTSSSERQRKSAVSTDEQLFSAHQRRSSMSRSDQSSPVFRLACSSLGKGPLDALATIADAFDGGFHRGRTMAGFLRLVAHFIVLTVRDAPPILRSGATTVLRHVASLLAITPTTDRHRGPAFRST